MNVAVIGLGLIGGSLVQALAATEHQVMGFDADPATRAVARTAAARAPAGARWQVTGALRDAVVIADLVVLAVPLPALPPVVSEVTAGGYRGLITDVTSVKTPVRDLATAALPPDGPRYVGGHPMAGREFSGFPAAQPDLFAGCAWVLCLESSGTLLADWLELAALVTSIGARAVPATASEHDDAVAAVSHVPHLLAAGLATAVTGDPLAAALAAGSFRDGTRVAATRPELVAAMCAGNATAVRQALDIVLANVAALRSALDAPDPARALHPLLAGGHAARGAWPPAPGEPVVVAARVAPLLELGRAGGWVTAVAPDRRTVTAVRPAAQQ